MELQCFFTFFCFIFCFCEQSADMSESFETPKISDLRGNLDLNTKNLVVETYK